MIKGIIFDLDGTLLNTLFDIQNSLNIVLNEFGYNSKTYDETRLAVGKGSKKLIIDTVNENITDEKVETILNRYLEVYGSNYDVKTTPYDGIKDVLEELSNKNILLGVNSNKPDSLTKKLVAKHFPNIKFVSVLGQRENIPTKPDPTSSNEIVSLMNINKDEVLYIGDSENDVKTAKNANIKCVGCLWGFRDLETLQQAEAEYIITQPKEILNLI